MKQVALKRTILKSRSVRIENATITSHGGRRLRWEKAEHALQCLRGGSIVAPIRVDRTAELILALVGQIRPETVIDVSQCDDVREALIGALWKSDPQVAKDVSL